LAYTFDKDSGKCYISNMKPPSHENRKELYIVIFIFLFSFGLRLIYLLQIRANPHFNVPTMDPLYHDVWAQNIASGNWMGSSIFFRAPFYPYFLSLVYKIFGHGYFIPRLIQHLVGASSCVLVYLLAKKLYNRSTAIIAGLIAATYGIFIYFESELLLDSFLVFFDTLLILYLLRTADSPKKWRWLVGGMILGVSAITRPNILFCIPFIWLWIYFTFKGRIRIKTFFAYSAIFLLGVIILVAPVTVRNYLVGQDLVLISSQGGINFYLGNNPRADGVSAIFYGADWQYRDFQFTAQKETGRTLKPSQISNYYYKKGLDFILRQPAESLPLFIKKIYLFWNRFEISNNQDIYFFKRYSSLIRILPLGFWLIAPLGLVGFLISFRERRRIFLPLIFVISYMITVVLFFVPARFRLPVIPFLIIFSSFAIYWLVNQLLKGKPKSILPFLIMSVPFFVLTNTNAYHLTVENFASSYFSLGNVYLKRGDLKSALKEYNTALEKDAYPVRVHLNKGIVFFRLGDYPKAEAEFLKELEVDPQDEKAYNNLSVLYRFEDRYDQAVESARRSIEIKPYYAEAYINLALAYRQKGDLGRAREVLQEAMEAIPGFPHASFTLAGLYQREGKIDSAIAEYQKVIAGPGRKDAVIYDLETLFSREERTERNLKARTFYNLGLIWAQKGEFESAERHFLKALELSPDFSQAQANLGALYDELRDYSKASRHFEAAIRLEPENPVYHFNLGLVYAKTNQLQEAIAEFVKALEIDPHFDEAADMLYLTDSLLNSR
jgi:tetratricopeptide (TPR) repeat protein